MAQSMLCSWAQGGCVAALLQVAADLQRLRISRGSNAEVRAGPAAGAAQNGDAAEDDAEPSSSQPRWPEFTGAFLLYFACIPPTPQVPPRCASLLLPPAPEDRSGLLQR
jgi:hypothetical protein